jgi:hypothetical protein
MDSKHDLELLTVTILSAAMFVLLYYLFTQMVNGYLTVPMAALLSGMGGLFSYAATQMLFSQSRAKRKKK